MRHGIVVVFPLMLTKIEVMKIYKRAFKIEQTRDVKHQYRVNCPRSITKF
jgi:hypothetical protein